jgi:hypothetical protein
LDLNKSEGRLILSMASRVGEEVSELLIAEAFEVIKEETITNGLNRCFFKGAIENVEFTEEKWNHEFGVA